MTALVQIDAPIFLAGDEGVDTAKQADAEMHVMAPPTAGVLARGRRDSQRLMQEGTSGERLHSLNEFNGSYKTVLLKLK